LINGSWPELLQKIQRGDFPRPRQIKSSVTPALEAICRKAMALEPHNRYASAQALAADIERWLADEPVTAWREPIRVRTWRWVHRNKPLVSAAGALVVSVFAAAAAGLVLLDRKNREVAAERNAARTAAEEAQAVNAFLTDDLLGQADPDVNDRTKKVTVEELLHRAAKKIDGNPKFAGRPEVEATLRLTVGKTFYKLGDFAEAERHFRRAMELRRGELGPDDPQTLAAQEALADFLNGGPGRVAEAEALARQTWQARARVLGPEHRDTLDSLDTYASALYLSGRIDEASARHQECLASRRRVLGPDHPDTTVSTNNLALALIEQGKWGEAIRLIREALDVLGRRGQTADYCMCVANLGLALYSQGDLKEAERLLRENVERSARQFGAKHPLTDRSRSLLVRVWLDQGRVEQAVSLTQEVVADRRRIYPAGHWMTANALTELGRGLFLQAHFAAATEPLAEALEIQHGLRSPRTQLVAWAECWRGASLAGLRRYDEAQPLLLSAERKLHDCPGVPARHYREVVAQLVNLYEAWGKPELVATWRKVLDLTTSGSNGTAR
jgi:tetratricopeptide (TPR) repeat protein